MNFSIFTHMYLLMLLGKRHIRQLNYEKTKFCVVNLRVVIFGNQRIKGFRKKGK